METNKQESEFWEMSARIIRAITAPPVLVAALLIILFIFRPIVFANTPEFILTLVFYFVIPLAAYPLSYVIPRFKKKPSEEGREGQRNLAFICNLLGYTAGLAYGLIAKANESLLLVNFTYFISVVLLIIMNKVVKVRASGHMCSIAGPLILLIYFIGLVALLPCIAIAALVVWASLYLKRHTLPQMILGAGVALVAFFISYFIILF